MRRMLDRVPALAAVTTALVGLINVASVTADDLPHRLQRLLALGPAAEVELAHTLALPLGLALVAAAWRLGRRSRRACRLAVVLLAGIGAIHLVKSLDVEEAAVNWLLAAVLWRARAAFWVEHPRGRRRRRAADGTDRRRAAALVRRHGSDTLSAFKLRTDLLRHWSPDGRALAAYRVEAGTLLLAGDPVGPAEAIPALLDDVRRHARAHGLRLGVVGASEAFAAQAHEIGLRRFYLGDEALLDTGETDLSGRSRASLRKAVSRLRRHGYRAELRRVDELSAELREQMEALSARWREGAPERGFSMAHDALVDELLPDALVVLAIDAAGALRGFLHFVPVFGRSAVSLGFMRRDRDTPNGLNDFLVVEAARLLGERGIAEFSLNFAACGRWLREPANALERGLAKVLRVADRWFQIERLLRFNAKFSPRWQPRYLLFDGYGLPAVALAALWAEGHLPRPPLPVRGRPAQPAAAEALAA
jgi:lysyl-tRNA synthetase class 2